MRILSVDDNADNLNLIEVIALRHEHNVVSVRNGLEALDKLAAGTFDLIVSDVLMPDMDGFQLCRTVKSDERLKQIPFVFYTATYTSKQDEELGLMLGASRFIVKPVNPEEFMTAVEQVVREGESGGIPVPLVDLDDGGRTLSMYNQRLVRKLEQKIEQLEAVRVELAASIDEKNDEIAQRRLTEQELMRSEDQLRLLWEASLDGMRLLDRDGNILWANPALARMFAKPLDSLPGQPFTCCYLVDDPESMLTAFRQQVESRTVEARFEQKLRRWDGEEIWVAGSNATLDYPSGAVVFSVLRDETQRARSEQERASLEQQMRQAQKLESIGRLAGGIAHDFNNLLTVINGYSHMLLAKLDNTDPVRQSVAEILKAGEHAESLTRHLLMFSRQQRVDLKAVNLSELLATSESMLQRLVGDDVQVTVRLPASPAWVTADTGQLHQVLMNLVINARDAMPSGGTLLIEVAPAEVFQREFMDCAELSPGSYVLLEVTDSGVGMDAEIRQQAFEPFFTTKGEGKGTGLGLSTVYGIVRQCGGSMTVDSAPGWGSTFRIYLPRLNTPPHSVDISPASAGVRGGSETILLVEDHEQVRALISRILRNSGYRVIDAATGGQALLAAERSNGPIQLLLTDIQMPQGTGVELAERLRPLRPAMRVLYMSAAAGESASPRIAKPFSATSLAARVREVLD